MENTLQVEIKNLLIEKFGFKSDDFHLLMAGPISEVIGETDSPKKVAEEIFSKITEDEKIPPEISFRGVDNVCVFLSNFNYDYIKEVLLRAAAKAKK